MKKTLPFAALAALTLASACSDASPMGPGQDPFVITPVFDDIPNDLDGSVDAVAEMMPLMVGGPNGTTLLSVVERNGDGKNGCNLTGHTTLVVSVSSSNPSVATVSPATITFGGCGETHALTVTPVGAGTATISLTQTSNSTEGTFNLAPATFTVSVSPASTSNTPPSLAITGVTNGASYEIGQVPAAVCDVTDAEDGNSTFLATLSAISGLWAADGLGSQTASCSYTDGGGLMASASVTYNIIDPSPPVISYVLNPASPDGNNGWYRSDVTLTWTVLESESPSSLQKSGCVNQSISADQAETTYSCSATSAGGSSGPVEVSIKRDATNPDVSLVGGPAHGGSYSFGSVPAAPTCSASDALSGLDGSCNVSGYSDAVGTHTVVASATDKAGNNSSATITYTVDPWYLSGFYQPVGLSPNSFVVAAPGVLPTANSSTVWNSVKSGSTVPLKFHVYTSNGIGGTEITTVGGAFNSTNPFSVLRITCSTNANEDSVDFTTTGSTSLRYDSVGGQFIQNWQTPGKQAGSCYRVSMQTKDGSYLVAFFKLK